MPPAYVKGYPRRQKNDAADAEAIFEAVRRSTMRFVLAKGADRQAVLVLHRSRELLVRQRTMLINAIRGHCAEFGLVAAQGACRSRNLIARLQQGDRAVLPDMAKAALMLLAEQLHALVRQIQELNRWLLAWHRQDQASQRLATIPSAGIISATAPAASVTDPAAFRSGREFSASLGLVPRQNSSGGKEKLGRISKMQSLPQELLVVGATSVVRRARTAGTAAANWVRAARAQAGPTGYCGHGQQDCPDRLGRAGARRNLSPGRPQSENNCGAHARPRRTVRVLIKVMMMI
jgi:transposase